MKRYITLALVLSVLTIGVPFEGLAEEAPVNTHQTAKSAGDNSDDAKTGGLKSSPGVVAAAVSILGFIALAASVDSGDATPTTTNH